MFQRLGFLRSDPKEVGFCTSVHTILHTVLSEYWLGSCCLRRIRRKEGSCPRSSQNPKQSAEHVFQNLVHTLSLAIRLRVIRGTKIQLHTQLFLEFLPKV